jgi:hypothetical protein
MLLGNNEGLKQEILAYVREAQGLGEKASLAEIQERLIKKHGLSIKPAIYDTIRAMGQGGQIIRESTHPTDVVLSFP